MGAEPLLWWVLDCGNREIKHPGKLKVALIPAGNSHDGSGSVPHQYIVRDPNRNLSARYRIGCK